MLVEIIMNLDAIATLTGDGDAAAWRTLVRARCGVSEFGRNRCHTFKNVEWHQFGYLGWRRDYLEGDGTVTYRLAFAALVYERFVVDAALGAKDFLWESTG